MGRQLNRPAYFVRQPFLYKCLLLLICLALVIINVAFWIPVKSEPQKCFTLSENHLPAIGAINVLEDISESETKPKLGKSIFFHETSCGRNGIVRLNARQACAIESAAKLNPNWDVYLLFASPVGLSNDSHLRQPIVQALLSYSNIHMRNVNLWKYAKDTPVDEWFRSGALFESKYLNSHTSDFLRYLSLYKWGGTYLDLDVIVQKPFDSIKPNYAGAESDQFVAAGVLNFDHDGFGHKVAELCLSEFQHTFDGSDWGNNGPGVITRVLQNICQTKSPKMMTRDHCRGFKVYPPSGFYAIPWQNWRWFFDINLTERALNMTKDSIIVHVWNKHSIKERIKVGSKTAYGLIAEKYCPLVYRSSGKYF